MITARRQRAIVLRSGCHGVDIARRPRRCRGESSQEIREAYSLIPELNWATTTPVRADIGSELAAAVVRWRSSALLLYAESNRVLSRLG